MKLVKTKELPEQGVSHNPEIKKRTFITRGEIPNLMMFGSAVFNPGQAVEEHLLETMYEVYVIQKGKAKFVVNGVEHILEEGDCITVEPMEKHFQENPFDQDVEWIYFGIAID